VQFQPSKPLSLKGHPVYSEKWLQQKIIDDPALLGLGDLAVKDVERRQPRAGRLDLLLQDLVAEPPIRYEVELQLGSTDETHIIRTIEYWDIERRRYPQYDHVAVIVAEDITSRFLNVISLFNGFIPLIAIQLSALAIDQVLTLHATKILDVTTLGVEREDEEPGQSVDRGYWEKKNTPETMATLDTLLTLVQQVDPSVSAKYNQQYIGLARNGMADNYVSFHPRRTHLGLSMRLPRSDELTARLEVAGLDNVDYNTRRGRYRLRLRPPDVDQHRALLRDLITEASGRPTTESTVDDTGLPSD
jgi:hypothetical protein